MTPPPSATSAPSDTAAAAPALPAIKALIVDAHEMVRQGLRTMLERTAHIRSIGEAATIAGAMEALGRNTPDVVLMELRLPDGSGIDACRHIRTSSPHTQVLILTGMADDESIMAVLHAGAAGVLLKTASGTDITRALDAVRNGQAIFDGALLRQMLSHLCSLSFSMHGTGSAGLSAQERRVMELAAQGKTNKEIARALGLSDKTIKNYLSNVYAKLQVTRRAHAASAFLQQTRGSHHPSLANFPCPLMTASSTEL